MTRCQSCGLAQDMENPCVDEYTLYPIRQRRAFNAPLCDDCAETYRASGSFFLECKGVAT